MSDFKARITAKLDSSKFEQQINKLQNKKFNVNVDTTSALQRLTALRRELDEIINTANNIRVNLANGNNTNNSFTNVVNQGTYAYRQLLDIQRRIGNISIKLNGLDTTKNTNQISVLSRQLNQLRADYQALQRIFNVHLNTDQMGKIQIVIEDTELKLQELNAKMQDTRNNLANSINVQLNNGQFKSEISDISVQISKLSDEHANINSLSAELNNNLRAMENSRTPEQLTTAYQDYENTLKRIKNELREVENQEKIVNNTATLQQQKNNFSLEMDLWLKKNSAAAKEFGTRLQELQAELKTCDATRLNGIKAEFKAITKEATIAGKSTLSFSDKLSAQIKRLSAYFSATMLFMESARAIRAMYDNVLDVDTAMTELYRVTDLTNSQYDKLYQDMISGAKAYATTLDTIINSTAQWVRLGFDADTAEQLAEISTMYQNVTDLDESTANENLVTAYKGFEKQLLELNNNDSAAAIEMITDIYDKLGNEFAESAADVGDGLSKSASVLSQGGASIQEAAGMFTGIQEVLQNSSTSGTALKILTLRIRGMKGELAELGEEVDDNIDSISKIQTQILNLTHGKVNIFDDKGNFRNIYDIMADISKIYSELTDTDRASLLEIIAGKNRANAVQALIDNWGNVEKATEAAYNSAGTAYSENEKYLNSLKGHIAQLKTTWQSLSNDVLDSGFVKGLVDEVANVLNTTDDIVKTVGTLPTLLAGIAAALSLIKNKGIFTVDDANKIQLLGTNLAGAKTRISELSLAMQRYNNVSSKSASFQASYNQSLQNSKSSMAQYLRSLNGANASLSGYAAYLLKAKVATIALRVASAALNTVATMGISWAISALISKIGELINAEETAYNQAKEVAEASREKVENISNEQNSLSELIEKYKELSKADMTDSTNRAEIKDIQDEITKLVGAQANSLDLVNGKLDEELAKLKDIQLIQLQTNIPTFEKAYVDAADESAKKTFHEGNILSDWNDDNNVITFDYWGDDENRDKAAEIIDKVWKEKGYGSAFVDYQEYILGFGDTFTKLMFNADLTLQDKINAINNAIDALENTDGFDYNNQTWKKLVEIKDALAGGEGVFTKQVEAAKTLLNELTMSEVANNNADIDSLEDYEKYRQEIINNITNKKTISQAIKDEALSSDAIETEVDNYLGTLDDFSDYYNEWYDKFGSDTVKGINEIKKKYQQAIKSDANNVTEPDNSLIDVFSGDVPQISPPNLTDEAKKQVDEFNNWIDGLSDNDKEIVYNLYCDTDTAQYSLEEWQKALEDYKATVDTVNESEGAFAKLLSQKGTDNTPSFSENIDSYIENINTLKQALSDYQKGDFSNESLISLIKDFPALANQTDNLDTAIIDLMNGLNNDMMADFDEQFGKLDTTEDIESLKALQRAVLSLNTNNDINRFSVSVEDATSSFDKAISAFDTIKSAINDYNENGYLTISNLKSLLSLDDAYLLALTNEQGALDLTTDKYKELVKAQALQMKAALLQEAIDAANSIDTKAKALEYLDGCQKEAAKSALSLADAKWEEALATAKARDLAQGTGDMYQQVVFAMQEAYSERVAYIDTCIDSALAVGELSAATDEYKESLESEKKALESSKQALEDKKSALEDTKNGYEDALNSVKDLIDWTEKYIKQTKEDEISSLEDKKQSIDDLIESQKELLQAEKDEYNWNKEIAEKQNAVASDALSASIASLDDSSAGKKAYKEANDALIESRSDMQDTLYEHEIDVRIDALEQMKEKSDEYYDSQIQSINNFLNDEVALYRAACSMIDNDNGTLYGNLLNYARIYTTTTEAEFNHMWYSAQTAMQNYNIANLDTFSLLNNLQSRIYEVDGAIDTISESIASYESKISGVQSKLDDLSNSAQNAVSQIALAMDSENKWREEHKAKWYYNWQGTKYESSKTDRNSAIQDILSQIEHQFGGRFPASAASIYGTIKHYAKGTKSAKGGISKVGENGAEYRILNQGDGIVTAKATENLEKIGSNPDDFVRDVILPKVQDELYIVTNSPGGYLSSDYIKSFPVQHSIPSASDVEELTNEVIKNLSSQNINNESTISPVTNINIQGDATQSTVRALQNEADKIVKRATENVMNIALRNKNII